MCIQAGGSTSCGCSSCQVEHGRFQPAPGMLSDRGRVFRHFQWLANLLVKQHPDEKSEGDIGEQFVVGGISGDVKGHETSVAPSLDEHIVRSATMLTSLVVPSGRNQLEFGCPHWGLAR